METTWGQYMGPIWDNMKPIYRNQQANMYTEKASMIEEEILIMSIIVELFMII